MRRLFFGRPSVNQLKKSIFQICGVSPVRFTYIAVVRTADERARAQWENVVKKWVFANVEACKIHS